MILRLSGQGSRPAVGQKRLFARSRLSQRHIAIDAYRISTKPFLVFRTAILQLCAPGVRGNQHGHTIHEDRVAVHVRGAMGQTDFLDRALEKLSVGQNHLAAGLVEKDCFVAKWVVLTQVRMKDAGAVELQSGIMPKQATAINSLSQSCRACQDKKLAPKHWPSELWQKIGLHLLYSNGVSHQGLQVT